MRVRAEGGIIWACEVLVVMEVLPPDRGAPIMSTNAGSTRTRGSRTTGSSTPPSRSPGYADAGSVTGTFSATEPFPMKIDLGALL
jgi:hypothetical protein